MCGVCGFTGQVIDRDQVLESMTEVITHRGPDSKGFYTDDYMSMGFRRLSIIDLDEGQQPIYNEDKSLVLTFNGEIYNYRELREELLEKGHQFYTHTDSEVLVHGFEEWGEQLLNRLRGMFGFAIWNKREKSLFLARDFYFQYKGSLPLYRQGLLRHQAHALYPGGRPFSLRVRDQKHPAIPRLSKEIQLPGIG